ncbi:TB2/DP1, HVA22 family-domain-containing protein [Fennellomyces sp. T-0311]|nr:TB2/DP1, HVA22 family-domain-containing protein [Fennellomyces sp. T-0311]
MDAVFAKAKEYETQLDRSLSQYQTFRDAEAKTKVPKVYVALGGASLIFFLIFFNVAGQLITNLIGWVYPAYESFKAIEASSAGPKKQWLTYWTVFGLVQSVEYFSDALVYWFPFYFLFKTALILWLSLPQFQGAEFLYTKILRPNLAFLQTKVEKVESKIKEAAGKSQ